jgi:hypothetical protein
MLYDYGEIHGAWEAAPIRGTGRMAEIGRVAVRDYGVCRSKKNRSGHPYPLCVASLSSLGRRPRIVPLNRVIPVELPEEGPKLGNDYELRLGTKRDTNTSV